MEVVGTVLGLPGTGDYIKRAEMAVGGASIAAVQGLVVPEAALVVARAVAGSWYTLINQMFRVLPQRYNGNE
jgi:hypothetical protein